MKLNLPILLLVVGQREKSRKYFDLSTFNYNLTDSNPCSSLGVMNFQKWELFSGSPGIQSLLTHHIRFLNPYNKHLIITLKLIHFFHLTAGDERAEWLRA